MLRKINVNIAKHVCDKYEQITIVWLYLIYNCCHCDEFDDCYFNTIQ